MEVLRGHLDLLALARGGLARSFRTRVDTAAFEEAHRLKRQDDEGGSEI